MRIWKYSLTVTDQSSIEMQAGATILKVRATPNTLQPYELDLWALVDPEAPTVIRHFRIVGTGHPIPDLDVLEYVGTTFDKPFVWHVFEVPKEIP